MNVFNPLISFKMNTDEIETITDLILDLENDYGNGNGQKPLPEVKDSRAEEKIPPTAIGNDAKKKERGKIRNQQCRDEKQTDGRTDGRTDWTDRPTIRHNNRSMTITGDMT